MTILRGNVDATAILTKVSDKLSVYNPIAMSSTILDNMKQTGQALFEGFKAWDLEAIMVPRAENCVHVMLPRSLGIPERTNQEFRAAFGALMPLFKNFKANVDHGIYDASERKAAYHATASAETPIGIYNNEYTFFLTFTEDGRKVERIEEMLDSAVAGPFLLKLIQFAKEAGNA